MTRIRVGAAVLNQTPLDWEGNRANILAAIQAAREAGVQVLCLPELCITGYGCEDMFLSASTAQTAWQVLEEIVPATGGMAVSLGLPLLHRDALFSVACLAVDGRIAGFAAKRFLASQGLHYEPRWFKPWPSGLRDVIHVEDRSYPIGDLVFEVSGVRIGFEICEDAWAAKRPGSDLSLEGIDLLLNPSASHFAFGKFEVRKRLVLEGSRAFGVSYVYSNLLGNEAGRIIYDGGALIASAGHLVALGPRFSFRPMVLTTAVVDITATRMERARQGSLPTQRPSSDPIRASLSVDWPDLEPEPPRLNPPAWEQGPHLKEEEFTRAVALGLFDYLRKSRTKGFVVNLSGGADSSATACLVAMMVQLAVQELGLEGFRERLAHVPALQEAQTVRECVGRLLFCLYQASRHSSLTTQQAAQSVAEAIGARFACLPIDVQVDQYVQAIEHLLGRPLRWETDDVALQNIQARVRGPSAWLLANVLDALLLTTSNRSEAAVGYATMDGDTCGGLAPLGGIDKAYLRRWLHWLQTIGPVGLGPIPALEKVTSQAPTAELRPPEAGQTDEGDLMPYEVLDVVERAAIRDKQHPIECFRRLRVQFPQYPVEQLAQWVDRFFRLWCRNQWKRERYAPSFHVDDENVDPKTWCRFPILSGGFQRELEELAHYVAQFKTA
jgi:NAD+ synthase (glutamine-hydrolysing)